MQELSETLLPMVALLGLASVVAAAAWLLADPRWRRQDDLLLFALRGTGQLLLVAGLLAFFLWSFGMAGFVISTLVLIVSWLVYAQSRAARRRAVAYLLAAAARRSMPLAPAVEALADESSGRLGGRLDDLAGRLRGGAALSEALAQTPRVAPPLLASAAALGEHSGCLAEAMRIVAHSHAETLRVSERVVARLWYVAISLVIVASSLVYLLLRILPRLQMIVDDFGIQLPPLAASIWGLFSTPWFVSALVYITLPLGLLAMAATVALLWNPTAPKPLTWLLWRLPLRSVLDLMSLAVERQTPLPTALCLVGNYLPPDRLRTRLRQAALEIVQGAPFEQALRRQKLLTPAQAGVLTAAERVGNLPWALREVAATIGRRETRRTIQFTNLLSALQLLTISLLVLMAALGIFVPLVQLLKDLQ